MPEQKRDHRGKEMGGHNGEAPVKATSTLAKKGEHLKAAMDDLLDELDDILEENAEEFVARYVQRGGQ
ncbi:MAG TPA: ubiquitin-like protein Pup [Candidatus Methylomirabilis sp.]|nr:ubiquitin-like protein Pup [Candidatus Methylomirabilis sp.]